MRKFFAKTSIIIFGLAMVACAQNSQTSAVKENVPELTAVSWNNIDVPFEVDTFFIRGNELFIVSGDEIGNIQNGSFKKLPAYKVVSSYIFDGRNYSKIKGMNNSCTAVSSVSTKKYSYITNECDHGREFRQLTFTPSQTLLNTIYSPYRSEQRRSGLIWSDADATVCNNRFLISGYVEKSGNPVLMAERNGKERFQTIWEGKREDGAITQLSCVEDSGWFVNNGGKLFFSEAVDKADWKPLTQLPAFDALSTAMKFVNKTEGYIMDKASVFETSDGGKTWIKVEIAGPLRAMDADRDRLLIAGSKILYYRRSGSNFDLINLPANIEFNKILLADKKVFGLSDGKLYSADLNN